MPTNHLSALFVFGGLNKVFRELKRIIRERLEGRNDLDGLEQYLELEENTLQEILNGRKDLDKNIFLALKSPLKLSLYEALGEPERLNDPKVKEYWEEELKSKPMRLVAYAGIPSGSSIPQNPIDLNMYVTLRAIGEFYRL